MGGRSTRAGSSPGGRSHALVVAGILAALLALLALTSLVAAAAPPGPPSGSVARSLASRGAAAPVEPLQAAESPAASAAATAPAATAAASADLRSSGQGAGPAGNPMGAVWAFFVVLGFGLLAAAVTLGYVRLTDVRRSGAGAADTATDGPGESVE